MKKKLAKNSIIYLGTEILNKSIPFLLLPILTKYLTTTEYGLYGMYQVFLSFFVPFVQMGLHSNITRNFFKVSKETLSRVLNTIIIILHLNILVGLILIFIISLFYNNIFGLPIKTLYLMPLIIYAQTINIFTLTIFRNEERAFNYGILQFLITLFNFGSAVILLLYFDTGWMSLVYGLLIGNFVFIAYSFLFLKKEFNIDFKEFYSFKEIYAISIPLIFHLLGSSIIFLSDRIFIQQMLGLKEVGLYVVGSQFGAITMIVINSIILAVNPWMYKKLADNLNIQKEILILMGIFFVIGIFVWLTDLIILPYLVESSYLDAKNVIFWISLAFIFRGWYQLYYNIILNTGKTKIFMYITFGTGVLNIILNYILIKQNGIIGASQATAIAFFVMFLSTAIFSKNYIKREKN